MAIAGPVGFTDVLKNWMDLASNHAVAAICLEAYVTQNRVDRGCSLS